MANCGSTPQVYLGCLRSCRPSQSGSCYPVQSSPVPESSSVPESNQSASRHRLSIQQLVQEPNRSHCIKLDPDMENGTWFGLAHEINKAVLRMLHTMLREPYKTYSVMPQSEKDSWHRTFTQDFTWDHWRTTEVLAEFDKFTAIQYSRHMNEWKQRFIEKKDKHKDLEDNVWTSFCEYWSQEDTKLKAATNSKNRKSTRQGKGSYVHNGGVKSTTREVA